MLSDLGIILAWWFFIFVLGTTFLPLTRKIFSNFFDQGYLFAKVLGILFSSYLVWLFASLKVLPFTSISIWGTILLGLVFNFFLLKQDATLRKATRPLALIWVGEELLFLLALTSWSFVRGFQPDIQGLEKFMDFGFVNSILKSSFFPPADIWFAGKPINYYYFGHYIAAFLTKLTGIASSITYNLMIGTLFAFTLSLTFSLAGNLIYLWQKVKSRLSPSSIIFGGMVAGLLLSLGANLHPAYYNLKMGVFQKPYCDGSYSYWYPNATRYIGYCPDVEDKTIHEFPSYSFIVSDLHGHVSDIPFVLLLLALILVIFLFVKEQPKKVLSFEFLVFSLPASLTLAIMYMTNQWDFPIYLLILGLSLFWAFTHRFGFSLTTITKAFIGEGIILLSAIPFLLPFQLNFEPIAKGLGLVHGHSLFYQLLILWGGPWFFGTVFLIFLFSQPLKSLIQRKTKSLSLPNFFPADIFVLVLFLVATLLVIIPEVIYVKDIYISSYHRANTMFKLTYQSFILYTVALSYIFVRVGLSLSKSLIKKITVFSFTFLVAALMIYPNYSIRSYYGTLKTANYKTLDGLRFLQKLYPDDYQVVVWLNQNAKGQPVILEAVGDSYTDYERISMATGLPTIEGWLVHEWLWRGSFDEPGKRATEVQQIYESQDFSQTKTLLQKYQVKYVIISGLERAKYPNLNEKKFESLGKVVFENGAAKIFELF